MGCEPREGEREIGEDAGRLGGAHRGLEGDKVGDSGGHLVVNPKRHLCPSDPWENRGKAWVEHEIANSTEQMMVG